MATDSGLELMERDPKAEFTDSAPVGRAPQTVVSGRHGTAAQSVSGRHGNTTHPADYIQWTNGTVGWVCIYTFS